MADKQCGIYSVSVVIPAYNVEGYIEGAIESVLSQSHAPDEIIVVDDGSTDGTADIIKKYGSKVCYIYQKNRGGSAARNAGIEAAKSEWIAFLDADDEWLPDKLRLQMELMRHNGDLVWSYTNYITCLAKGDAGKRASHNIVEAEELLAGKEFFEDCLYAYAHGVTTHTITLMVRRDALLEAGMFLKGQKWAQDVDLTFRLAYRQPRIGYISKPLAVHYFQISGGITEKNWKAVGIRCDFIDRHLKLSAEYGREEEFKLCASRFLKRWIRTILREDCTANVSEMVERFGDLIPRPLTREVMVRRICPRLADLLFAVYFPLKRLIRWKRA